MTFYAAPDGTLKEAKAPPRPCDHFLPCGHTGGHVVRCSCEGRFRLVWSVCRNEQQAYYCYEHLLLEIRQLAHAGRAFLVQDTWEIN